jgi:hypothetical protein
MSLAAPGSDTLAEPDTVARAGGQPDAATSSARMYACTRQRKGRANGSNHPPNTRKNITKEEKYI